MSPPAENNNTSAERFVIANDVHAVREPEAAILRKLYDHQYSEDSIFAIRLAFQEAIVNAMAGAETVVGVAGLRVAGMPADQVRAIFE